MNKIFKNMIGNDNKKPIWTEKQKEWIKKKKDKPSTTFFSQHKNNNKNR